MTRRSGVLLPIYALPSNYGCGTLGKEAHNFIDWLSSAGQNVWQILPVGETGESNSPMDCNSFHAGNSLYIDLDELVADGFLTEEELHAQRYGFDPGEINYSLLRETKKNLLHIAYERGRTNIDFTIFKRSNDWLEEYSLYRAAKEYYNGKIWNEWPDEDLKCRKDHALLKYRDLLTERIDYYSFVQFLFYRQWEKVKKHAREAGIELLGELPHFVSIDSPEVWAHQNEFRLDEHGFMELSAGRSPNIFGDDGELYSKPLYDWSVMRSNNYAWWKSRIAAALKFYDVLRLDEFSNFDQCWVVPITKTTDPRNGHYEDGPKDYFLRCILSWFGQNHFIADDRGNIPASTAELRKFFKLPGIRILENAFDGTADNKNLAHNIPKNSLCYIGSENDVPSMAWISKAGRSEMAYASKYLNVTKLVDFNWAFIRCGMASPADLFIIQIQDVIASKASNRSTKSSRDDWNWRFEKSDLDEDSARRLFELTYIYARK